MSNERRSDRFVFDGFEASASELSHRGVAVPIEPTPLAVLLYLIQRRPEIVTRDELRAAVWPDVYLHDATMAKAVWRAREALGDDSKRPTYIETVPRRGYRFVGKVRVLASLVADPLPEDVGTDVGEPRHPGDRSQFVRDMTVPDGSVVFVNQTFVKIWEIANVGSVPWRNRFLLRLGPPDAPARLKSAERTPMPDTEPGERCQIAVELTAPRFPGSCYAEWKMVDAAGVFVLPNQYPVYVSVDVRERPRTKTGQA